MRFIVRCFFLLTHSWVVQEYEYKYKYKYEHKSTSQILILPLTLECIRVLSSFISFFSTLIVSLMMFCVRLLTQLIWCSQLIMCQTIRLVTTSCNLILKCNTRNITKCNSVSKNILIFKKFYICKLIHIELKSRILIASFLLAPLQLVIFLALQFSIQLSIRLERAYDVSLRIPGGRSS